MQGVSVKQHQTSKRCSSYNALYNFCPPNYWLYFAKHYCEEEIQLGQKYFLVVAEIKIWPDCWSLYVRISVRQDVKNTSLAMGSDSDSESRRFR